MDLPLAVLSAARTALHTDLVACTLRVRPGEAFIRLIPDGEFTAPRGALAGAGPWRLTPEAAARVIAANRTRTADILIDFEHQALLSETNGRPVPAAGWIDPRSLEYRPDGDEPGLYGRVTWVGDTAALIAADRYRYLSPVFPADRETGEPLDLLHVALTNFPAIDEPISAALSARLGRDGRPAAPAHPKIFHQEDSQMELLKKLLAALGLPETTSEPDALAGVTALKTKADAAQAELVALKAASPVAPDPTRFVPIEAMRGVQDQLAALSARIGASEADQVIEKAIAEGRLLEPQRAWAKDLGAKDLAALKAYVAATPAIAALSGMQSGAKGGGGDGGAGHGGLTADELAVCKALGMTAEEFKKGKEA